MQMTQSRFYNEFIKRNLLSETFLGERLEGSFLFLSFCCVLDSLFLDAARTKKYGNPRIAIVSNKYISGRVLETLNDFAEAVQLPDLQHEEASRLLDEALADTPVDLTVLSSLNWFALDAHLIFQRLYFNLRPSGFILCQSTEIQKDANILSFSVTEKMFAEAAAEGGFSASFLVQDNIALQNEAYLDSVNVRWEKIQQKPNHKKSIILSASEMPRVFLGKRIDRASTLFARDNRATPQALIYSNFLEVVDDMFYWTLEFVRALDELGFSITVASTNKKKVNLEDVKDLFGFELKSSWEFMQFNSENELVKYAKQNKYQLFVNSTSSASIQSLGDMGVFLLNFPEPLSEKELQNVQTYKLIACRSDWTAWHVKMRWGDSLSPVVLTPPIADIHFRQRASNISTRGKQRLIIDIGYFGVLGNNRCQIESIEAFCSLLDKGILSPQWKLVVAGYLKEDKDTNEYFDRCCKQAERGNIEVIANPFNEKLCELYKEAAAIWQFSGISLNFGQKPEQCEDISYLAMNSVAYGVIPIVFHRGGMSSLIDFGCNGFNFGSLSELEDICALIEKNYGRDLHKMLFENSLELSKKYTFSMFKDRLENVLRNQEF